MLKWDQGGFGIVQTVMSLGMLSLGATALYSISTNSMKAQKNVELVAQLDNAARTVQIILAEEARCTAALSGATLNATAIGTAVELNQLASVGGGTPILTKNADFVPGLRISKILVRNLVPLGGGALHAGELAIEGTKSGVIGSEISVRSLPIFVEVASAAGVTSISKCYSASQGMTAQEMCEAQMGGVYTVGAVPPCQVPISPVAACTALGGTHNGTACTGLPLVAAAATPTPTSTPTGYWTSVPAGGSGGTTSMLGGPAPASAPVSAPAPTPTSSSCPSGQTRNASGVCSYPVGSQGTCPTGQVLNVALQCSYPAGSSAGCPTGQTRNASGVCSYPTGTSGGCPSGQTRNAAGQCSYPAGTSANCPSGQTRNAAGQCSYPTGSTGGCPAGQSRNIYGQCARW
jgi:hypothetical protein